MNLHGIVSGAISIVNPMQRICIEVSTGYTTQTDGTRLPTYDDPVYTWGQIQPLTGGDLRHVDSLNLQGQFSGIYIQGRIEGLVRPESKGGDKITFPDRRVFLVTQVLEDWPDWTKVVATRQNE